MSRAAQRLARIALGIVLAAAGLLLAWEFVTAAPAWSSGWFEGASYAVGALAVWAMAALLWRRATGSPLFLLAAAMVPLIPGLWCLRSALWLVTVGPEIGPIPAVVPLAFALAGALLLAGAAVLVSKAVRSRRNS